MAGRGRLRVANNVRPIELALAFLVMSARGPARRRAPQRVLRRPITVNGAWLFRARGATLFPERRDLQQRPAPFKPADFVPRHSCARRSSDNHAGRPHHRTARFRPSSQSTPVVPPTTITSARYSRSGVRAVSDGSPSPFGRRGVRARSGRTPHWQERSGAQCNMRGEARFVTPTRRRAILDSGNRRACAAPGENDAVLRRHFGARLRRLARCLLRIHNVLYCPERYLLLPILVLVQAASGAARHGARPSLCFSSVVYQQSADRE